MTKRFRTMQSATHQSSIGSRPRQWPYCRGRIVQGVHPCGHHPMRPAATADTAAPLAERVLHGCAAATVALSALVAPGGLMLQYAFPQAAEAHAGMHTQVRARARATLSWLLQELHAGGSRHTYHTSVGWFAGPFTHGTDGWHADGWHDSEPGPRYSGVSLQVLTSHRRRASLCVRPWGLPPRVRNVCLPMCYLCMSTAGNFVTHTAQG